MNLIDRYVLREWLTILALVLGATVGLMFMQALYDDFRPLLDRGASLYEIAIYMAVKIPSFLAIILPIALLVSLLYGLGQLHRSNEITAMRAAGLGIFRITRTIWASGLILCAVMFLLNTTVVPWSVEASRTMWDNFAFRQQAQSPGASLSASISRVVTFDNQRQGRMWFFNRYNRGLDRAYGVTVSELDSHRREKTRFMAREARFDRINLNWTFSDGREEWLDPETGDLTRTKYFIEKVLPYTENPDLMLAFDLKPADLSFFQLRKIIDYFTVEENPKVKTYAVRYFGLLSDTLAPLIVIALAIPFAVTGVRVNPAVGVSKSIGLFLVYFIFLKAADAMGARGTIEPLTAAWLPNVAMLSIGGWFFLRLR